MKKRELFFGREDGFFHRKRPYLLVQNYSNKIDAEKMLLKLMKNNRRWE